MDGEIRKHGSGIYIREGIVSVQLDLELPNVTAVHLPDLELFVVGVYRPPSYVNTENQLLINFLGGFCVGKNVMVLGDFNLPSLKWQRQIPCAEYVPPLEMAFYDAFLIAGLGY